MSWISSPVIRGFWQLSHPVRVFANPSSKNPRFGGRLGLWASQTAYGVSFVGLPTLGIARSSSFGKHIKRTWSLGTTRIGQYFSCERILLWSIHDYTTIVRCPYMTFGGLDVARSVLDDSIRCTMGAIDTDSS